ncbi:MAG: hypothetical protein L6R28_09855 [Planctomycetes bacterium]|nr:hypothetical protein [Planctomycetota bacterium]
MPEARTPAAPPGPAHAEASSVPSRKPAAGSYGLVVVLGFVFLLASVLLAAVTGYILVEELSRSYASGRELLVMAAVTAGLPCLGLSLLMLLRNLAPIDAAAVHLAWRRGALSEGMPQTPGSSLPYILPLTAGGGLLAILPIIVAGDRESDNSWYWTGIIFPMLVLGTVLALVGLALGEVRRFLWRMEFTANSLAEHLEAAPNRYRSHPPGHYGAAWIVMLTATGTAVITLLAILADMSYHVNRQSFSLWLAGCLAYPGGLLSLAFVTRAGAQTLGAWNRALSQAGIRGPSRTGGVDPSPAISRLFLFFSAAWGFLLLVTVFYLSMRWRSRVRFDEEFFGPMSIAATASLAAFWFAMLFAGVHRARALADGCLDARTESQAIRAAETSPARLLKWAVLGLAALVILCFLPELRGSEWFLLLLVMLGLAYATVWLGFLADELRLLAVFLEALSNQYPKPAPPAPALSEVPPEPPGHPYA